MQRGFRRGFCWFSRPPVRPWADPAPAPATGDRTGSGSDAEDLRFEAQELRRRLDRIERRLAGLSPEPNETPAAQA